MRAVKEIGAVLYEARTEQGLTLEELSERTRIRVDYLKAVEEGNPEKVPGEAYFRAFIRTYAREVGLDPEELLVRYEMGKMPEAAQLRRTAGGPLRSGVPQAEAAHPIPGHYCGTLVRPQPIGCGLVECWGCHRRLQFEEARPVSSGYYW